MGVYDYMGWEVYFVIPTIIASAMGIVVTLVYFKAQGKTQRAVLVGELLLLAQAVLGLILIAGASAGAEMGPAANAVCLFGVEAIYVLLSFVTFVVAASAMTEGREVTLRTMRAYAVPVLVVLACLAIPATRDAIYTIGPDGTFQAGPLHGLLRALACGYTACSLVWEWRYRSRVPRVTHLTVTMTLSLFALYAVECVFHLHMITFSLSVGFAAFVLVMGQIYGERWESKSAELQEAANTDELTGLLNRRGFNDEAHRLLAEPGGGEIAMFMADLDDFKIFNDQYGHRVGDAVLKDFAQQLKGLFGDGAVVARTGGDEFHVLLKPDTTLLAKAREALQGEHAFLCEGKTIRYRASAGYTLHTKADAMLDELVRQSDLALYHGKIVRDGTVQAYNESMEGDLREQLGFTARDLAQLIPAGILICKNGESRRVLFANDRCLDIFGCKSMADLAALSDGDYGNLVPQGEMKRIKGKLFNLTPAENASWVETRVRRADGSTVRVYAVGHNSAIDRFGDLLCVLIFRA